MDLKDIITLLGGVALFLFGMSLMGEGLKKVAGNRMELVLYKLTGTPVRGVLLGTGVTAIIQSSSATSAMVVGFVNSGMMKLTQAISVIEGALIGTSITGWIEPFVRVFLIIVPFWIFSIFSCSIIVIKTWLTAPFSIRHRFIDSYTK